MPLTGIDDAWQSRLPQGWTTLPDGSVGPSSAIPDWLRQLIPAQGAGTPYSPGGAPSYGTGPGGVMPGGGLMGRQAVTPGGPSMGFPAQGGPQVIPPQNSTIPPGKSIGPFTGGTSTEGSYYDPRNWFKANPNATFQAGQPMGPDVTGGAGAPAGLSALGNMNPYARAAIAAGGVMAPTPAGGPDAPTNLWMQRPSGVGAMPGPQVTNPAMPARPYSPTPANYPSWPTPGPGSSPAATMAGAPPGNPSDTPRPSSSRGGIGGTPRTPTGSASRAPAGPPASNSRFSTVQYQVPGSGYGPLSRSPIYTALNLFGGRS